MKKILYLLTLAIISPLSSSQDIPFPAKNLQNYTKDYDTKNFTRLRLNITTTGLNFNSNSNIRSQDIIFCGGKECFQASSNKYLSPIIDSSGNSTLVLDSIIPINKEIEKIYFKSNSNSSDIIKGDVSLDKKIKLGNEYPGYQILVELNKDSANTIKPVFATSEYYRDDVPTIFYNPERNVNFKLKSNFEINIPFNSLKKPKIFLVIEDDVKKDFPLLDIYPHILLDKNISINTKQSLARQSLSKTTTNTDASIIADRTKSFRPQDFESNKLSLRTLAAQENKTCAQIISEKKTAYINSLNSSGVSTISDCENIPPYVHIVLMNGKDQRRQMILPFIPYPNEKSPSVVKLTSIENYKTTGIAGINGFTWDGDEGTAEGQRGVLLGYVDSNKKNLVINLRNKTHLIFNYNFASWKESLASYYQATNPKSQLSGNVTVGSTTSIIKSSNVAGMLGEPNKPVNSNMICSTDTTNSRWSAIGSGILNAKSSDPNLFLLVSSTSSGETNAAELCNIYKAFNIANAIRLDGGPSAAMIINQVFVNPLQGLYRVKYGSSRKIAYPLIIK